MDISTPGTEATANFVAAFGKGLSEAGYIEGRNVAIEYRWARNDSDRLPELVGDLVRRRVTAIVTPGSIPAARAAKVATESIPIVFSTGGDPVQAGLVSSLNRPGGNVTGILSMNVELMAKRLGLMHELVPGAARFAVLVNPDSLAAETMITDLRAAASAIGQQVEILAARSNADIDAGYASLALKRIDALLVTPDPWFISRRATHHAGDAPWRARDLSVPRGCGSRRPGELRIEHLGRVSAARHLCRPRAQG